MKPVEVFDWLMVVATGLALAVFGTMMGAACVFVWRTVTR